ncbi:hypothetical protein BCON_0256g00120 [Botryotinia convoluta]|uniref:Uncharacterized protein n=1 Tax=Botryotinia convoluta TaxID=54673 RepID=A0A4Z1HGI0_9HELO|nr:hypothetical protein BCON_0256g00120 [Botryotinia convoluta]
MPGALTQNIVLFLALVYACLISVVLMPIFLIFNAVPIRPGELIEAFLRSQTMNRLRGNYDEILERVIGDRVPGARDAPDDELPQARREWVVSRHEIMMGREFRISQYRGFLHELQERSANRVPNNRQLVAPPEIDDAPPELVDDSGSEDEFDIHDWDMSLP